MNFLFDFQINNLTTLLAESEINWIHQILNYFWTDAWNVLIVLKMLGKLFCLF